jgi:6-pyruvoyltetrahydropterin/6-carboxytetrahydropterin synthase
MYELIVESHFDAAHFLRGYRGKCEAMHGHRYRVVARIRATELDDIGLSCDFGDLKKALNEVLARYDHVCLNDISPFDKVNPSAENIAAAIYRELKGKLVDPQLQISCIEAWESPTTGVAYRPDSP